MFDWIIPLYFEFGKTFESFLLDIVKCLNLPINEFEKLVLNDRRQVLIDKLGNYKPSNLLIYLDSYESISEVLNNDNANTSLLTSESARRINSFLENVPANTFILLTSRHRHNLDVERRIRLDGLNEAEGRDLFIKLANNDFLAKPSQDISELLEKYLKR